ncbi:hypothetical protein EDC04DRAFT_2698481 [Pisolithus marmoratus]|nr:hypothetical protein EDC04DRAFT_2698481 [Pisolithus marmoratus]
MFLPGIHQMSLCQCLSAYVLCAGCSSYCAFLRKLIIRYPIVKRWRPPETFVLTKRDKRDTWLLPFARAIFVSYPFL